MQSGEQQPGTVGGLPVAFEEVLAVVPKQGGGLLNCSLELNAGSQQRWRTELAKLLFTTGTLEARGGPQVQQRGGQRRGSRGGRQKSQCSLCNQAQQELEGPQVQQRGGQRRGSRGGEIEEPVQPLQLGTARTGGSYGSATVQPVFAKQTTAMGAQMNQRSTSYLGVESEPAQPLKVSQMLCCAFASTASASAQQLRGGRPPVQFQRSCVQFSRRASVASLPLGSSTSQFQLCQRSAGLR